VANRDRNLLVTYSLAKNREESRQFFDIFIFTFSAKCSRLASCAIVSSSVGGFFRVPLSQAKVKDR